MAIPMRPVLSPSVPGTKPVRMEKVLYPLGFPRLSSLLARNDTVFCEGKKVPHGLGLPRRSVPLDDKTLPYGMSKACCPKPGTP